MMPSISGIHRQPQFTNIQNSAATLSKARQSEEASESPAERMRESSQSSTQTNSSTAMSASSTIQGNKIDFRI